MSSRAKGGLKVVFCLFAILFVGVADSQIISPLLPAIRTQVGKSSATVGLLFTGYSIAAALSVLIWGPLSDAFGRKRGLLAGLMIFCLGSIAAFMSKTFEPLLLGRIITGMGASMISLNAIAYAADFFPYSNRGWAMSSIMASYFAALIMGVPIGTWIGDRFGWSAIFAITAVMVLLLFLVTCAFLPALSGRHSGWTGNARFQDQSHIYAGFLTSPTTRNALLGAFLASAGTMGFLAYVGVWLHDTFGISAKQVGLVFLVSGGSALLASPFAGSLSDKIGKRRQFILSNICLAIFLILLPGANGMIALFVICGLISLSAAFRQGPMEALLTEIVATEMRGAFVALKNSFSQLGIALAALVSGMLLERSGYPAVCLLCAAANVAAAAMIFKVQDKNIERTPFDLAKR
jgi:predicted MFS family arabinose efflux permease